MRGKVSKHMGLTLTQHEALVGSMLGDGHLDKETRNARYRVLRAVKDDSYLKYEANIFSNLLAHSYINGIKYRSSFDKRTNKTYYSCLFATITNSVFTDYHNKWYKEINGKFVKIVPLDLELSSLTMAHWIADDGSIKQKENLNRLSINLHTEGFSKNEVEFLANLLNLRYNECFSVYKHENHYMIYAADSASRVIINDIDSIFIMQRKRLWDKPEVCYYSNQPARQISTSVGLLTRKETLEDIINTETSISMVDLATQLNYWVPSKNQPNYQLVNKLIKPYLDNKIIVREKGLDGRLFIKINKQVDGI